MFLFAQVAGTQQQQQQAAKGKYALQHTFCSSGKILAVTFSRNLLATGSKDRTAKLWDLPSRKLVQSFEGHTAAVRSVAFSPSGEFLATASDDNSAKLWDVQSRSLAHTFRGFKGGVATVAFSPADDVLATGAGDKSLKFWDVRVRKLVHALEGHETGVASAAFSPAGDLLATGSSDNTAKLWDTKSKTLVHNFKVFSRYLVADIVAVAFSPSGDLLATGYVDNTASLWDVRSRSLVHTFEGHKAFLAADLVAVAFSPSGDLLATGSGDEMARLWDVRSRSLVHTFEGHADVVAAVAFSPAGDVLATGASDSTVKLWGLADAMPAFFRVFVEADRESWSSEKALDRLGEAVCDVNELTLFYSAASAAYKHGDIALEDKRKMICDVLSKAPRGFQFDKEKRVAMALKLVIEKAENDGVVDRSKALRLDWLVDRAETSRDERYVGLVQRVASLKLRTSFAEYTKCVLAVSSNSQNRASALDYARRVDADLGKIKKTKRRAAMDLLNAVIAAFSTIGVTDIFSKVVDFSDTRHVVDGLRRKAAGSWRRDPAPLELIASDENLESLVERPLHESVRDQKIDVLHVQAAAFVKACLVCNGDAPRVVVEWVQQSSSNVSSEDDSAPNNNPRLEDNNAEAVFDALKRELGCDEATEIDADADFAIAVENYFDDLDFDDLGDDALAKFLDKLRNKHGRVTLYMWKNFSKKWHKSAKPLADYIKSL
ncbi:hypothetical protein CTAYLR_004287 [Chrysophaeum taylorii]|uniref:Uncharacterized protein n=1 Tax=Chrysophaeum taylorii TaxID=2483200 RepID=A0AAD7XLW3_9STRA|nr:hypothetical protein CTAYLR_004287 [Chrysophaeum taylorii]